MPPGRVMPVSRGTKFGNLIFTSGMTARDLKTGKLVEGDMATLARATLDEVIAKQTSFPEAVAGGKVKFTGNAMRLAELMGLMDEFPRMFEIVEPRRTAVS